MVTKEQVSAVTGTRMPITRLASIPEGSVIYEAHVEDTKKGREHFFRALVKYGGGLYKVARFGDVIKVLVAFEPWKEKDFKRLSGCDYLSYVSPDPGNCTVPQDELQRRLPCAGAVTISLEPPNIRVFTGSKDIVFPSGGQDLTDSNTLGVFLENIAGRIAEAALFGELKINTP